MIHCTRRDVLFTNPNRQSCVDFVILLQITSILNKSAIPAFAQAKCGNVKFTKISVQSGSNLTSRQANSGEVDGVQAEATVEIQSNNNTEVTQQEVQTYLSNATKSDTTDAFLALSNFQTFSEFIWLMHAFGSVAQDLRFCILNSKYITVIKRLDWTLQLSVYWKHFEWTVSTFARLRFYDPSTQTGRLFVSLFQNDFLFR